MAKFCIKLGEINKLLLFPFLLALARIIIIIVEKFYPEKQRNIIMDGYSMALGHIAIIIIPHIKYFSVSNQKEKTKCQCQCTCKNFLHYFILLVLYFIDDFVSDYSTMKITEVKSFFYPISELITTKEGIVIILITILAKLMLKYEYFIHHYLSISFFVIFCVSIDLLLESYSYLSKASFIEILFNSLSIITRVIYLCYIKYLIDKQYHYYWNIVLSRGILLISVLTPILILILIIPKGKKEQIDIIFYSYFDNVPVGIIISKFIINFILQFVYNTLQILTIFYLSPEYILISENIARILSFFLTKYDNYKLYICIIFFILQLFSLMIYLEILELDFLNLNKNTKRNIKLRVDNDNVERTESLDHGKFEAGDGYIFESTKSEKGKKYDEDDSSIELEQLENKNENDKNINNEN